MLPELLGVIILRMEASGETWPHRQNVVACGCVCKRWRDATAEAVEKASLPFTEKGKFLLAARRYRNGAHTEYIITLDADDPSPASRSYVGKLRSDFAGTNFKIYESKPPHSKAKPSSCRSGRRVASKQISPQAPVSSNYEVGQVSYKFNLLKSRGPRRMVCSLSCPNSEPKSISHNNNNFVNGSKMKEAEPCAPPCTILKNKAPRWHENLECWCLNFHGRVTVASVKNFQLIAKSAQRKG